ncbi:MAG: DUF4416 family protein [Pseudomonadota bacterium]
MSEPRKPPPARLVVSIIYGGGGAAGEPARLEAALARLDEKFGPMDFRSPAMEFTFTDYYNGEMGEGLRRLFVSFKRPVGRETLADIKLFTNGVEKDLCRPDGSRQVNIDPGLLSLENFILATAKNFTHRVYLRDGIFADLTLVYSGKKFNAMPWTFPDYSSDLIQEILAGLRKRLADGILRE